MAEDKKMKKEDIVKSQAKAKSKSQKDVVKIELNQDTPYYKKGDIDYVHPATAEIFKARGLIK